MKTLTPLRLQVLNVVYDRFYLDSYFLDRFYHDRYYRIPRTDMLCVYVYFFALKNLIRVEVTRSKFYLSLYTYKSADGDCNDVVNSAS